MDAQHLHRNLVRPSSPYGELSQKKTGHKRWHGPLMGRFLGGPLRLNEWAADDIFSGWTSPSCYEPPANVEKNFAIVLI